MHSLPGNVCAAITKSLDNFVIGTFDMLSVEHVTEMLDHIHVHAGPIDPCIAFRIKQPFVAGTIGDWHI
jgi:hypothetical protein